MNNYEVIGGCYRLNTFLDLYYFYIVLSHIQWLLQSRTKLLEKGFPIMSTFLRNKNISKTTPLRKEKPFPQFNVASYKRPGIRLPFEYTTTLLSGEGAEERTGTATMFRKMLPKYAIFSTVLSKIVVIILNYLLHIFSFLFSFYSIGLLVILETHVTCIRLKYIKRRPCIRPKFVLRESTLSVIHVTASYRLTKCQFTNEPNREISRGVFQNHGTFGQAFPPPAVLAHPSIFHFFCFPSNSVTRLGTLSDEG